MVWLLIILCLAVVVSPLMWMKNSPRQQKIKRFRDLARELSIKVSLHRRPEARDSEDRLEAVCYWRPWDGYVKSKNWTLHRYSERGWPSAWKNWQWFQAEASAEWSACLHEMLSKLPDNVSAIVVNNSGVGIYWDEKGDESNVYTIGVCLKGLIEKGEEIYT